MGVRRRRWRWAAALALLILLSLTAAYGSLSSAGAPQGKNPRKYTATFVGALDTVTTLTAWCGEESLFQEAAALAEKELNRLSSLYDRYDPDSALSRLNSAEGEAAPVPDELSSLLAYCIEQSGRYPGCNIALGGVTALWEQARETGFLPSEEALREAGRHTSLSALRLDGSTAALDDPDTRLDLGGVAKGDAADRVAALLKARGLDCFLLSCGESSLVCEGTPPSGSWRVGLRHPDASLNLSGAEAPPELLGTLSFSDLCLSVSGDYQQYFCVDGTYYSHLIDPDTLSPARYYRCVCVLADSAREAEMASKALFVEPPEQSRALAERETLSVLWVMADGSVETTDGFPGEGGWKTGEEGQS